MIEVSKLTKNDVGRWVWYKDYAGKVLGRIKSWNNHTVFVVYHCDQRWQDFTNYTGSCTNPKDLYFLNTDEILKLCKTRMNEPNHEYEK